jgi:hypothetical protein
MSAFCVFGEVIKAFWGAFFKSSLSSASPSHQLRTIPRNSPSPGSCVPSAPSGTTILPLSVCPLRGAPFLTIVLFSLFLHYLIGNCFVKRTKYMMAKKKVFKIKGTVSQDLLTLSFPLQSMPSGPLMNRQNWF